MATEQIWHDQDGMKVGVLKDWRWNPLTTTDRNALGLTLGISHIGLSVLDIDEFMLYFWNGTEWVTQGTGGGGGPVIPEIEIAETRSSVSSSTNTRFVYIKVDEAQYNVPTLNLYLPIFGLKLLQLVP